MELFSALAALAGIWFLAVTLPGPNFIVVSQISLSGSRKSGLYISLGVSTAACVWAASSLLGLKAVFEHANWLYDTIRLIGGIYLVYMGLKLIIDSFRQIKMDEICQISIPTRFAAYRRGLFTSFSNPKTAAFFGSIFVTTFPPQAPVWAFILTLGIVFTISLLWYSLVAVFFSLSQVRKGYTKVRKIADRLTGSLLLFLGFRLAFSRS
ncbi:MAG: LysE family transporter [Proteobacteria bacterium]|nr:LysE family transporter [Pseudomonadota bacterium]